MTDRVAGEPDPNLTAELQSPEVGAGAADASQILDVDSNSPQAPAGHRDPEPPDAAPGTDGLVPRFPLEEPGTWLVLYDSTPGELRARWSLARTDVERFGNSFPVNGSRPEPVLRLRRSRPEGGTELADEVSLIRVARERSGDVGFRVGSDHCRYHAELGLATGVGGWLMLARSNGLDNAATIGLRLPVSQERRQPLVSSGEPAEESDAYGSQQGGGLVLGIPTGCAAPTDCDGASAAQPSLQHSLPVDASLHAVGPTQPDSPEPYSGLVPRFPLVQPARGSPIGESGGTACMPEHPSVLATDGAGLSPESVDAGTPGDARLGIQPQQAQTPSMGRPLELDLGSGPAAADIFSLNVPIEPMVYGDAPAWASGLRLEAELRILGEAPPGSLIDLFGHPFRVGPGGRFLLTLRVDDPDLLRRALDLQPPPELKAERDE